MISVEASPSYYRARYYDPQAGKFLNEDPIAFLSGTNFYSYTLNSPLNYTDPEGEFILAVPLPIATGIIGGLAGGLGDLGGQVIGNIRNGKPLTNIDVKEVIVATGTGAVAGALAPIAATTWAGAAILGGVANVTQKLVLNHWEHKCTTSSDLTLAFAMGALGGLAGGPTSASKAFSTSSPYLDSAIANRANQATNIAVARANASRTFAGGLLSNQTPKNSTDCGCN